MESTLEYIWQRLPLILLFASGYMVYRVLVVSDLTGALVRAVLRRSGGGLMRMLLYIMSMAAFLSFFMPNTVAVLALLPIVRALERDLGGVTSGVAARPPIWLTTALMLALIYGANIGGMGSLIGSPANLMLIGWLDVFEVAGREQVTYGSWFIWSIPLVTVFGACAWGMIVLFGLPRHAIWRDDYVAVIPPREPLDRAQRVATVLSVLFTLFWICESAARGRMQQHHSALSFAALFFTVLFLGACFVWRSVGYGARRRPLLRLRDLVADVPRRGLFFVAAFVAIIVAVRLLALDSFAVGRVEGLFSPEMKPLLLYLVLVLAVIILTEVFSNTLVSATFFPTVYVLAESAELSPLEPMLAVSLASTCAFMTPIATPCNALAYGEMRGVSLRRMMLLGLALNLIGAVLISTWLRLIIPLVYS